jgi:hypothetical protein
MRWLLPLALILTLVGYFGPWIGHPVAGLVITGLDFGEYVKFLPIVREGTVTIWRPGFYAPLVACSAAALLAAYRRDLHYGWSLRFPLLALAIVAALNLIPPAWTPTRLLEAEFRWQTSSLILLLVAVAVSPYLALLPRWGASSLVTLLATVGIATPVYNFLQVLPAIETLYNHPLVAAWGLWVMVLGLLLIAVAYWRIPDKSAALGRRVR